MLNKWGTGSLQAFLCSVCSGQVFSQFYGLHLGLCWLDPYQHVSGAGEQGKPILHSFLPQDFLCLVESSPFLLKLKRIFRVELDDVVFVLQHAQLSHCCQGPLPILVPEELHYYRPRWLTRLQPLREWSVGALQLHSVWKVVSSQDVLQ